MYVKKSAAPGWALALVGALVLAGCGSKPINQAPVEDRNLASKPQAAVKPLPGIENAGKPGYYTVKPGDTLIRIGLDAGQSYKEIAKWNTLENPDRIEVGQVLRVVPPAVEATVAAAATAAVVTKPVSNASVTATPIAPANGSVAAKTNPATAAANAAKPSSSAATSVATPSVPVVAPASSAASSSAAATADVKQEGDVTWMWPASGSVVAGFDEVKNKGLDISGAAGDDVLAAADGLVVYAGAGLRGYGNLVILKHNNVYLTAYAHNQSLLVKEDQVVKRGQKIAKMGNTDADKVKLHFEVRKQGKPVDPSKYLPSR